jgi:hypothetical protein
LVFDGQRRLGFEVKRSTAPTVTRSMRSAVETLKLDRLDVIHAGDGAWPMAEKIRAVPLRRVLDQVPKLRR